MKLDRDLYKLVMFIVVLSSAFWLYLGIFLNEAPWPLRVVMVVVGTLALVIMPCTELYTPYVGETLWPAFVLDDTPLRGNVAMQLTNLPPKVKVIYWASGKGGVATTSGGGVANITLQCDGGNGDGDSDSDNNDTRTGVKAKIGSLASRLGIDKDLPDHVYFRYELTESPGMFSRVHVEKIVCE